MPDVPQESWDGERAARWVRNSAGLERQLAPVSELLFAAAGLVTGEAVLDVGCGTGPTTREAATAVGPTGRVTGLDVSEDMVTAAAVVPLDPGAAPLDWVQADPVTWSPPAPPPYDMVLSRFGVMFFSDPVAAFATLARGTRPGGRLTLATWARRDESELFAVPLDVALRTLDRLGIEPPVPDEDVGPFSLHDAEVVDRTLTPAGWSDIDVRTHDVRLLFVGGAPPHDAAVAALDFGPTRVVTAGIGDGAEQAVVAALAESFASHLDDNGHVVLGGRVRIVRAAHP